jgi:hypothetical protein
MRKKDLYSVILKITGLVYIITLLPIIPLFIFQIVELRAINLLLDITLYGIQLAVIFLLIFQSNFIIKTFRLDADAEDELEINFSNPNKTKIIEIGLILFALFIGLKNLMAFMTSIFFLFKMSVNPSRHVTTTYLSDPALLMQAEWNEVYLQLFGMACAFLMITFHVKITKWILKISGDEEPRIAE